MMNLRELASAVQGQLHFPAGISADAQQRFVRVCTDSREVSSGALFVALKGERFDAHDFVADVANRGAVCVLVNRIVDAPVAQVVVPHVGQALGLLAACWREQFALPLIAVTGSNGKTTTKEMIASILAAHVGPDCRLATQGNLNNDIGVPMTLLRLRALHRVGVVELGMNHVGEIAQLAQWAQPTIGLVTNAQREHQEFMHSVEAVARENGAVIAGLPEQGIAVFPAQDEYTELWQQLAGHRKCVTFGLTGQATVHCQYKPTAYGYEMTLFNRLHDQQTATPHTPSTLIQLHAYGEHNVRNALAAAASALAAGVPMAAVARGLSAFRPVKGRLVSHTLANGATLIDDTYNANPDSVRAAIDVLAGLPGQRMLVLGDMGEVGEQGPQFHAEVGGYAKERGVNALLTLGQATAHSAQAYGTEHNNDVERLQQMAAQFIQTHGADAVVLVKGSRFMKMERVVNHLSGLSWDAGKSVNQGGAHAA